MVGIGTLLMGLAAWTTWRAWKQKKTQELISDSRRFLWCVVLAGPLAIGVLWLVIGSSIWTWEVGLTGPWSGLIVAGVGAVADLLVGPWRARPATSWMNLWILHSMLRVGGSIALVILLYSASSPDPVNLLFSYLACFLVGLAWETAIWTEPLRKAGRDATREQQAE